MANLVKYRPYIPLPGEAMDSCVHCQYDLMMKEPAIHWGRLWNKVSLVAHERGGDKHPIHEGCIKKVVVEWQAACPMCRAPVDVTSLHTWRDRLGAKVKRVCSGAWRAGSFAALHGLIALSVAVVASGGSIDSTWTAAIGGLAALGVMVRIIPIAKNIFVSSALSEAIVEDSGDESEEEFEQEPAAAAVFYPAIQRGLIEGTTLVGLVCVAITRDQRNHMISPLALTAAGLYLADTAAIQDLKRIHAVALFAIAYAGALMVDSVKSSQIAGLAIGLGANYVLTRILDEREENTDALIVSMLAGAVLPLTGIVADLSSLITTYAATGAIVGGLKRFMNR